MSATTDKRTRQAVSFRPDARLSRSRPPYVDFSFNLDTALTFALDAFRHDKEPSVFLWMVGYAGTGKTSIVDPLCWALRELDHPVSLLKLNCMLLACKDQDFLVRTLRTVDDHLEKEPGAVLVLLDEVEAICRQRQEYAGEAMAAHWTIELLRGIRETGRKAIVLASSNYPDQCDMTFNSEMGPKLYFPAPTVEDTQDLLSDSRVPKAAIVAQKLHDICTKLGSLPLVRPLYLGLKSVPRPWGRHGSSNMATFISGAGHPRRVDYEAWESAHTLWKTGGAISLRLAKLLKEELGLPPNERIVA